MYLLSVSVSLIFLVLFIGCQTGAQSLLNAKEDEIEMTGNGSEDNKTEDGFEEITITELIKRATDYAFEEGCVRDESTAIAIADAIFRGIYGEDYNDIPHWDGTTSDGLPLLAFYNEDEESWLIRTQLPDGIDGVDFYVIIRKSNAEVIGIWLV